MSPEEQNLEPEIAHILSIDVVGYSKLLVNEQIELLNELKRIVRETNCACAAEASGRLIRLPTGDGMVLLFFRSPEEPVQCAVEIAEALQSRPHIRVRMGAHSGPVNKIVDVNDHLNVAGAGVNVAQRVLDSGDAGHILLSKRLADDLAEYSHWRPHLYDLGECVVKHGFRVHLVNFHRDSIGNPNRPRRIQDAEVSASARRKQVDRRKYLWLSAAAIFLLVAVVASYILLRAGSRKSRVFPEKSLAVLPFENLSEESSNAYFADGVQGEILTLLSKVASLKVIGRVSVMRYRDIAHLDLKKIAEDLGVRYFLEGSVQRADKKVRVSAALIDARSEAQLWSESYDENLADVFKIQTEIAEKIVARLEANFTAEEKAAIEEAPTTDLAAYDLYLRGKALIARIAFESSRTNDLLKAAEFFQQATERDPSFYLAYCQLANAHDQIYFYSIDHTPNRLALAQAAVDAAVRLRPDFGETHLALATHYYFGYRDYDRARQELGLAERKLPNDPFPIVLTGYIDRREGDWASSTERLQRALELDPRNLVFLKNLAHTLNAQRNYPEMRKTLDRALAILPGDPALQVQRAGIELDARADTGPMRRAIATALAKDPQVGSVIASEWLGLALCEGDTASASRALAVMDATGAHEEGIPYPRDWIAGVIARMQNDPPAARTSFLAARAALAHIPTERPNFAEGLSALGMIDAALGDKENAIREGSRAVEMLPTSKDAIVGPILLQNLALIHAWTGEKTAALEELTQVTSKPSYLSYGQLRLHPLWAPLRSEARFQEIVTSLAPSAR
ncbi:MAG TPA: tetratricopeptide repeat protein [Chthoniobacterales bacterium]|nr:tetratricopeptide repeat protein [Chthoniobacterales bacterium]